MANIPRPRASDAYDRNQSQAATLLDWIKDELSVHAQAAQATPDDWELVRDVAEAKRRLMHALACLSRIPEAELEEAVREAARRLDVPKASPPVIQAEARPTVSDLLADADRCLTEREVAIVLGVTVGTLASWRSSCPHQVASPGTGRNSHSRSDQT